MIIKKKIFKYMVCGLKIHTPYIVFYEKNKAFRAKNKEKSS